jgi:hypothetical protein
MEDRMKKPLILIALVTGCGASDQGANQAGGDVAATPQASPTQLTGLYEGGSAHAPDQLCVVEKDGQARFGMLIWGANLSACGGAGVIERDGDRLSLRMTGDQACTVSARLEGRTIRLAKSLPSGCSYYCGAQVSFEGATFARKGATLTDAMKARDPAGDPLCSK